MENLADLAHDYTPQWVLEMHRHYDQHGYYRVSDILRVIGDQTQRVEMTPPEEMGEKLLQRIQQK